MHDIGRHPLQIDWENTVRPGLGCSERHRFEQRVIAQHCQIESARSISEDIVKRLRDSVRTLFATILLIDESRTIDQKLGRRQNRNMDACRMKRTRQPTDSREIFRQGNE